jgi:hypothetical protein
MPASCHRSDWECMAEAHGQAVGSADTLLEIFSRAEHCITCLQSTSSSSSSSSSSTPVPQAVQPVRILDCGCGSAYLTLCTFHYLNNGEQAGLPAG